MILEEVMSQTRSTNNINIDNIIDEHAQLVLEHNELLSEMADMFVNMLNEECIFMEGNFFSDMKVKKEDLADPNKVKAMIKQIERDDIVPSKKDALLNFLYVFLLTIVGMVPGGVVVVGGLTINNFIIAYLGELIAMIGGVITGCIAGDRFSKYITKTKKAINKVEKALKKETDPKMVKSLKKQKDALEKNLKAFEDANYKQKKEIHDKRVYNY